MYAFPISHWGGLPVPAFYAPLRFTTTPTIATGSGTATHGRSGQGLFADWENIIRIAVSNEPRFTGARRVQNLVSTKSEDWTNASWTKTIGTVTATTLTSTGANQTVLQTTSPSIGAAAVRLRVRMSRITGTGNIQLTVDNGTTWTTVTLTGSNQVFSIAQTTSANPVFGIRIVTSGDAINADQIQLETTTGQSNTNPSEYVSVGVLSAPFHGACVDGVQYFGTLNGNTVSSNVVTEATGAALTPANGASSATTDSGGPIGFFSESGHTNLVPQCNAISTAPWNVSQATVTTDTTTDPMGLSSADKLKEDNTNNEHQVYNSLTATAVAYTLSAYLKQAERTWGFLSFTATTTTGAYFDLANGSVGNVDAGYTAGIAPAGNGFYRCWITKTATATTWYWKVETASANGTVVYTGTTGNGIYVWGVQLETGTYPRSLILTTTTTQSIGTDNLTYVFTSNASASVGTAYAETKTLWATATAASTLIGFKTTANGPLFNNSEASTTIRVNDGTNTLQKTGLTDMQTAFRKRASTWASTTMKVTGDGASAASGSFSTDMGSTNIGIGASSAGANTWNGLIRNVRIWKVALTTGQLQALTA